MSRDSKDDQRSWVEVLLDEYLDDEEDRAVFHPTFPPDVIQLYVEQHVAQRLSTEEHRS